MFLTICPKCAYQRLPADAHIHEGVCPACGIAYQKFLDRAQDVKGQVHVLEMEALVPILQVLKARMLELPPQVERGPLAGRAAVWCMFALWAIWFMFNGINGETINNSFLHAIIIPFHEFGHLFFMPLGDFMSTLGGSLFQVLMPLGLMLVFLFKQRDTFGASVMLWWAGQSLVDLSPYVGDAIERAAPLIGGLGEDAHDWGNLLTTMDLLDYTLALSRLCFMTGVIVMLAGLAWGALLLRMQYARMQGVSPAS